MKNWQRKYIEQDKAPAAEGWISMRQASEELKIQPALVLATLRRLGEPLRLHRDWHARDHWQTPRSSMERLTRYLATVTQDLGPDWLDLKQASRELGVLPGSMRAIVRRLELPLQIVRSKQGYKRMIHRADLERLKRQYSTRGHIPAGYITVQQCLQLLRMPRTSFGRLVAGITWLRPLCVRNQQGSPLILYCRAHIEHIAQQRSTRLALAKQTTELLCAPMAPPPPTSKHDTSNNS